MVPIFWDHGDAPVTHGELLPTRCVTTHPSPPQLAGSKPERRRQVVASGHKHYTGGARSIPGAELRRDDTVTTNLTSRERERSLGLSESVSNN